MVRILIGGEDKVTFVVAVDEDRVGVIIGARGTIERRIERMFKVKIKINPSRGEVLIISSRDNIDGALKAKTAIEAISLGIPPNLALSMIEKPDYVLEIVNIEDYARGKSDVRRIKSRLIGRQGRIRMKIEDELNVKIAIKNKHVAIIGHYLDVMAAKEAIVAICRGSKYGRVMRKIEEYKLSKMFRGVQ